MRGRASKANPLPMVSSACTLPVVRTNRARGWCLLAIALVGCTESPPLSVDLRTDLRPGVELWSVVVGVYRGEDTSVIDRPSPVTITRTISTSDDTLGGVRIIEEMPLSVGSWVIHARLFAGSTEVGSRVLLVEHDGPQELTMVVTRRCALLDCVASGTSPQACRAGVCVDPRCTPETPERCGSAECASDADCGTVGCVAGACIAGECAAAPDDSSCGGGTCDREMGCLGGMRDGGVDGGVADSGVDAGGPFDAGVDASCVPESDSELCDRLLSTCGTRTVLDRCGVPRTVDCGGCSVSSRCEGGGCVACASGGPCVTTSSSDFETGTAGSSVAGIAGWSVRSECGRTYDEAIVDDGTGNLALRISNAITTECFDQIYSPCPAGTPTGVPSALSMATPDVFAGESSTGSTYRRFVSELRFRSATLAAQDGLRVEVSAVPGNGDRQSLVVIRDTGSGFDIEGATETFGTGLSYTEWHTLRTEVTFVEGDANDTVAVTVDGVRSVTTATSFEEFYRVTEPAKGDVPVQCLLLRVALPDVPATFGRGLLIDDVQTWLETP